MIFASIAKVVLFFFVIVFAVANQKIYVSLVPVLLAAMLFISGIATLSFLICYIRNYTHKEWKILSKVTIMSVVEFFLLGLAFCQFWKIQVVDVIGLFWMIPFFMIVYWCLPTYSKKRNG